MTKAGDPLQINTCSSLVCFSVSSDLLLVVVVKHRATKQPRRPRGSRSRERAHRTHALGFSRSLSHTQPCPL